MKEAFLLLWTGHALCLAGEQVSASALIMDAYQVHSLRVLMMRFLVTPWKLDKSYSEQVLAATFEQLLRDVASVVWSVTRSGESSCEQKHELITVLMFVSNSLAFLLISSSL